MQPQSHWPALAQTATPAEIDAALQAGADINYAEPKHGNTAILLAARGANYEGVAHLIARGADVNKQNRICLNPFLWGCISGDLRLVRMMLAADTDLDLVTRFGGVGIHPAAEKGHLEIVELLVTTNVNVNHTNICGWTPLLEAIILGDGKATQQRIVALLLQAEADPNMVDQWGVSPLAHANKLGFDKIAALLRDAGGK